MFALIRVAGATRGFELLVWSFVLNRKSDEALICKSRIAQVAPYEYRIFLTDVMDLATEKALGSEVRRQRSKAPSWKVILEFKEVAWGEISGTGSYEDR